MIARAESGRFSIPILHEDNHLLVAVKPPNLPAQADRSGDEDLLTALKRYIGQKYEKPGAVYLGLLHRLDRPVGGVMVFARTSKAAARLSKAFSEGVVDKRYLAVVDGRLIAPKTLEHWLIKDKSTGMVRESPPDAPDAKHARLLSRPIVTRGDTTLVDIQLFTGRPHQIRVQHQLIGHPLWGDNRYGAGKPGQQIALWAYRLAFEHPTRKTPLILACPPPLTGAWASYRDRIEEEFS